MYSSVLSNQTRVVKNVNLLNKLLAINASSHHHHQKQQSKLKASDETINSATSNINETVPNKYSIAKFDYKENFAQRHIGINAKSEKEMLKTLKLNVS